MARKYEDFDDQDQDGVFDQILTIVGRHKKGFALASVSTAVILLGVILWGTYPGSEEQSGDVNVPIVRADAGDYKTTPENPGGMEIPYRDSTVFSSGENADGGTENILAEDSSEEPVPRSQLFAGLNTEEGAPAEATEEAIVDLTATNQPQGEVEEVEQQLVKAEPVTDPKSTDALVKEAIGSTPDTKELAAATNAEAAKSATTEKPAKAEPIETAELQISNLNNLEPAAGAATPAKAVSPGGYYVQLASVKSETDAKSQWPKLKAQFTSLSDLDLRVQKADLGAKGTYYRIQGGPVTEADARKLCSSINSQKSGSCVVAKR